MGQEDTRVTHQIGFGFHQAIEFCAQLALLPKGSPLRSMAA